MRAPDGYVFIYALRDPSTERIRYVGKSVDPVDRYWGHQEMGRLNTSAHCARWLRGLRRRGLRPELLIVDLVSSSDWQDRECAWIRHFRDIGEPLTNLTLGGDGLAPNPCPEIRENMRSAQAARWQRMSQSERNAVVARLRDSQVQQRVAITQQGSLNRKRTSRFRGVTWSASRQRWNVEFQVSGRRHWIGYFQDELDAARAYDLHAFQILGPRAKLNFPGKTS